MVIELHRSGVRTKELKQTIAGEQFMKGLPVVGAVVAAFVASSAYGQASGYFLERIRTVPGSSFTPIGITDTGLVAGVSKAGQSSSAVIIDGKSIKKLPPIDAKHPNLTLSGVNSFGAAAGQGLNASSFQRGIYWDTSGTPWELIPFGDRFMNNSSTTAGISENHIVVGTSDVGDGLGSTRAMIWKSGLTSDLVALPVACGDNGIDGVFETGLGISPNGRYVAGSCIENFTGQQFGAVWTDANNPTTFSSNALNPHSINTSARAVNNSGLAVGEGTSNCTSDDPFCIVYHAYMWSADGTVTSDLGSLGSSANTSYANSINSSQDIVGSSSLDSNGTTFHAVMWKAGNIVDLHQLMAAQLPPRVVLQDATQITDEGKILVSAINTTTHAPLFYRLTPATHVHHDHFEH
jgi:uncharacterized membrane protein